LRGSEFGRLQLGLDWLETGAPQVVVFLANNEPQPRIKTARRPISEHEVDRHSKKEFHGAPKVRQEE
jgi:hypothetical protein